MVAWSLSRQGAGKFSVTDADTAHCSHIIYAFLTIDESSSEIKSIDPHFDQSELPKLKRLKNSNPNVKVLISIGGWNQGSKRFSDMASSRERRRRFINSAISMIKLYGIDGIDLCWQFPGQRGGIPQDKQNVLTLLRELKDAFSAKGYILTIHILGQRYVINSYDIKAVSEIVDYINFAAVEYHGPWEKKTAITTPLTSSDESNVKFNLDYILDQGVPASKILLGLPLYGHVYILAEAPRGQYLGLFYDHTDPSQWTNEPGLFAYNEACYELTNSQGWTEVWEEFSQTPLIYNDRKLASYDNKRSLTLKAKLIKEKNLAGVMFWSLDMDDFRGLCQEGKYPIVSSITEFINKPEKILAPVNNKDSTIIQLNNKNKTSGTRVESFEYGNSK